MRSLSGHQGTIRALVFGPDGNTLISAGSDGTIRIWDLSSGQAVAVLKGHDGAVNCLALHDNGRVLASGGADRIPRLWDHRQATLHEVLPAQMAPITGLAWLHKKTTLLVACGERARSDRGGEMKAFHFGPQAQPRLERLEPYGFWTLAASTTEPVIAWGGGARNVTVWNITQQQPRTLRQSHGSLAIALAPDRPMLASAVERTVNLWDLEGVRSVITLTGHRGLVGALAFSPDGRTLASGGRDRAVKFWALGERTATDRRTFEWPAGAVYALAFSPDGMLAAAGGDTGLITVWDVDD